MLDKYFYDQIVAIAENNSDFLASVIWIILKGQCSVKYMEILVEFYRMRILCAFFVWISVNVLHLLPFNTGS